MTDELAALIHDLGDDELMVRLLQRGATDEEARTIVERREWPDVFWMIKELLA